MPQKIVIMPCLDLRDGRVVKGVRFTDIRDAGDPVECCEAYCRAGADELTMLDITATLEGRQATLAVVRRVAAAATVPFTVGGGINSTARAAAILEAGATRISASSGAFRTPELIAEMVREFGTERVTVAIDAAPNSALPSGYEVYIDGGNTATGHDVAEWARQIAGYGVSTILPTSKSADGAGTGYDLELITTIRKAAAGNVVASGGAGELPHFAAAIRAGANILLAASVFHFNTIPIPELKRYLAGQGFNINL